MKYLYFTHFERSPTGTGLKTCVSIWHCVHSDAASSSMEVIEMDSLENDFGEPFFWNAPL